MLNRVPVSKDSDARALSQIGDTVRPMYPYELTRMLSYYRIIPSNIPGHNKLTLAVTTGNVLAVGRDREVERVLERGLQTSYRFDPQRENPELKKHPLLGHSEMEIDQLVADVIKNFV